MPMYTYKNFETGVTVDKMFKFDEKPETVIVDGVTYQYVVSCAAIVSGVGGLKVPSNLKDRLNSIKKVIPSMQSSVV